MFRAVAVKMILEAKNLKHSLRGRENGTDALDVVKQPKHGVVDNKPEERGCCEQKQLPRRTCNTPRGLASK